MFSDPNFVREPTLRKALSIPKKGILCSTPYGTGNFLAGGLTDGVVNLFPCDGSKKVYKLVGHKGPVTCIQSCFTQPYLASGSVDGTVRFWVGNEQGDSTAITVDDSPVHSISLSQKFDKIIVATDSPSPSLWDPRYCKKIIDLEEHDDIINSCSISTDGLVALTGCSDGTFRIFDLRTGSVANHIEVNSPITATSIRQTGTAVAIGCDNGYVYLWDTRTQAFLNKEPLHHGPVTAVDYHPTKSFLLTASADSTICVCDADDRRLLYTLKCHTAPVNSVRWSIDGTTFSSSGEDRRIVLWDEPIVPKTEPPVIKLAPKKRKIEKLDKFNNKLDSDPEPEPTSPIPKGNMVEVEDTTGRKKYVAILHKITDQIVSLSKTMSSIEAQMNVMDERIKILEAEKRRQAKKAITNAQLE